MRQRTKERPPVPTDEEIRAYDNVPVDVAARYLDWTEHTLRLALREGRVSFGVAVKDRSLTYKISPGGLIRYKREGLPLLDYATMQQLISAGVQEALERFKLELSKEASV